MSAYVDTSRSTSGYVMTYAGGALSWQSRLQKTVVLSTTEAEYMAAFEAYKEILCMKDFIGELGTGKMNIGSIATVKVPSTLPRMWRTIPGRSTFSKGITGSGSE